MSNYIMHIELLGHPIRCETEGLLVNLNDMERAGNAWRLSNGMPAYQLGSFINSKVLEEYLSAATTVWDLPPEAFLKRGARGRHAKTMAHISIAVLLAEQMSPVFHATVHKTFIEGKLLEFREHGGTEFKNLNIAIDRFLPYQGDKKPIYIQTAIKIRNGILRTPDDTWATANVGQTHSRYEIEKTLCQLLKLKMIRDWDHLKEVIDNLLPIDYL